MINDGGLKLMIPGCWKWLGGREFVRMICITGVYDDIGEITW